MEALKNIEQTVPEWLTRLDDLNDQIDKRQVELAELADKQAPKSIRNRGSTESLRPKEETEGYTVISDKPTVPYSSEQQKNLHNSDKSYPEPPSSPTGDLKTPAALQKQSHQVMAVAQARARAMVKRKIKTASLMSNDGDESKPPKYRTRTMVIIYYDSYVQSFFEELVKFVSASRNLLRKAKMAAKVAQIRKLAELELPDEDSGVHDSSKPGTPLLAADPATDDSEEPLPPLRYMSSRRMGPMTRTLGGGSSYARAMGLGAMDNKPDIYENLDKMLEIVQSMCEHGAHQFLRDGTCAEEITKIRGRLTEARNMALKEVERIAREEPEKLQMAQESKDLSNLPPRINKSPAMRKDTNHTKVAVPPVKVMEVSIPKPHAAPAGNTADDIPLEVDDDDDDDDEPPPPLVFRSTRAMRPRQV